MFFDLINSIASKQKGSNNSGLNPFNPRRIKCIVTWIVK